MTAEELAAFGEGISQRHQRLVEVVEDIAPAPEDVESTEHATDAYVEALFLRAFTAYENDLETLFLHYVTGGSTLAGVAAHSYLRVDNEAHARKLTRGAFKFLSWAKPHETRTTADNYLRDGWPISSMMNASSQDLSDCERVRNRIAHNSLEAVLQFNVVQRNMLQTERIFPITPGQFLRIRSKRLRKLHISHYVEVLRSTLEAIMMPPP